MRLNRWLRDLKILGNERGGGKEGAYTQFDYGKAPSSSLMTTALMM